MVPKLWKQHPNFFIIYFVTATVLHLGLAYTQYHDKERYMNLAFSKMYEFMSLELWALCSFITWFIMMVGAYHKFHIWGRLGLGLGLFLCLSRGLLIELGPGSGGGMFVWFTVAALHYTQLSEPTHNPLTQRE